MALLAARLRLGLRGRIVAAGSAASVLLYLAAATVLVPRLERAMVDRRHDDLTRLAVAVADRLEATPPAQASELATRLGQRLGVEVLLVAADGTPLGSPTVASGPAAPVDPAQHAEIAEALAGRPARALRREADGRRWLHVAVPEGRGALRVSLPTASIDHTTAAVHRSALVAALLGLLLSLASGTLVARGVAGPLEEMTALVRGLTAGRFGRRLRRRGRGEVRELGTALEEHSRDLERLLAALVHERDMLGAVLNGMVDGVLVTDPTGRILRTNPALERHLGLGPEPDASPGRTVLEATRNAALSQHVAGVADRRGSAAAEIEFAGPPGRVFLVSSAALPADGGAVTVFHDVSELRRLERVRRDFVANVSHELRTPVAALQAAGETLLSGALADPVRAREFTEIVARNAERLGRLVSDLLALARLDSGELDLVLAPIELRPAVERVLEALAPRLEANGLLAADEVAAGLEVEADERALEQVLVNLLDNAVKYAPAGGRIGVEATAAAAEVTVVVWDTGPGLEPRHRARVFERFYRVDAGRSRALGGTGLGLSIVKHMVEAMGGKTGVDGREEGGSRFWFTLRGG